MWDRIGRVKLGLMWDGEEYKVIERGGLFVGLLSRLIHGCDMGHTSQRRTYHSDCSR